MNEPYVHKIFTGKVKQMGDLNTGNWFDQPWENGMFKEKTDEHIWLGKEGLHGDEFADAKNYDRSEKAIFTYPIKHYAFWQEDRQLDAISMGTMGENFAVLEMDEFTVCVGDTYQFGDAMIQVSQPHFPDWKVARHFQVMDFAQRIQNSGRTGWYFRVLEEGNVLSRVDLELIERPYPQWTVAACNEVMHVYKDDLRLANDLLSCKLIGKEWKQMLQKRLRGQEPSIEKRFFGPNKK